jgi:hypothetical protein
MQWGNKKLTQNLMGKLQQKGPFRRKRVRGKDNSMDLKEK